MIFYEGNVYVYIKKTVTRSVTLSISSMIKSFSGLADDNLNAQILDEMLRAETKSRCTL